MVMISTRLVGILAGGTSKEGIAGSWVVVASMVTLAATIAASIMILLRLRLGNSLMIRL